MPRRTMKHNIEVLEEAGYNLDMLKGYLNLKDLERRGVVQVWECNSSNCLTDGKRTRYEAFIRIQGVSCPKCGKTTRRLWPK